MPLQQILAAHLRSMHENIRLDSSALGNDPEKVAALYPWLGGKQGAQLAMTRSIERSTFDATALELASRPMIQALFAGSLTSLTRVQQSALRDAYITIISVECPA